MTFSLTYSLQLFCKPTKPWELTCLLNCGAMTKWTFFRLSLFYLWDILSVKLPNICNRTLVVSVWCWLYLWKSPETEKWMSKMSSLFPDKDGDISMTHTVASTCAVEKSKWGSKQSMFFVFYVSLTHLVNHTICYIKPCLPFNLFNKAKDSHWL